MSEEERLQVRAIHQALDETKRFSAVLVKTGQSEFSIEVEGVQVSVSLKGKE